MGFEARILADSIAPNGKRLVTQLWKYPRPIHSEIMTNRAWSKNSASSRAIPTATLIKMVNDDPWIPDYIGKNQKGMQPGEELTDKAREDAVAHWLNAKDNAVYCAEKLLSLGVHKGVINRVLEPWMWITIIASATEMPNMYALRLHKDAEPHYQHLTRMSKVALDASTPRQLKTGEWHLPMWSDTGGHADDEDLLGTYVDSKSGLLKMDVRRMAQEELRVKIAVGRCARVSYLTHDGRRYVGEHIALHDRVVGPRPPHASPAEHVAQALDTLEWSGNFQGWRQYRKTLPHENITSWDDVPLIT